MDKPWLFVPSLCEPFGSFAYKLIGEPQRAIDDGKPVSVGQNLVTVNKTLAPGLLGFAGLRKIPLRFAINSPVKGIMRRTYYLFSTNTHVRELSDFPLSNVTRATSVHLQSYYAFVIELPKPQQVSAWDFYADMFAELNDKKDEIVHALGDYEYTQNWSTRVPIIEEFMKNYECPVIEGGWE